MESIFKKTVLFIKVIGKMIYKMVRVLKSGEILHNIKANIVKEKKKAKVNYNLQMVHIMKVNLLIILLITMVNLYGIVERLMKVIGSITK